MKIKINKNKSIGKVIYIVEGDVTEPTIIETIFNKLLNYEIARYKKSNDELIKLTSNIEKYSRVFVVPAKNPQINQIEKNYDYFYDILNNKLGITTEDSSIYFIFDRDRKSNRPSIIKNHINKYYNSKDNDMEMNGLFLLSYPCIEASYLNALCDKNEFSCGKDIKDYVDLNNIDCTCLQNEKALKDYAEIVIEIINNICTNNFEISDLDNFKRVNSEVFEHEEHCFISNKVYLTLSLLIVSLIDLGIIEITD